MILYFLLKCEVYYDTKYEKKCETDYKEVCHGYGYHQKCYSEPVHHCHEVPKKVYNLKGENQTWKIYCFIKINPLI